MDPHGKYLFEYYQKLLIQLTSGKATSEQLAQHLVKIHQELETRADYDGLTKNFLNNQGFTKSLDQLLKTLQRLGNIVGTLLALDIDNLKKFNDTQGHPAGDKLIQTYAKVIIESTRVVDLKGRLGGDEFVVFLTGADLKDAQIVAERIRIGIIQEVKKEFPELPFEQTVSIGICVSEPESTIGILRERADKALYEAKREKNKIVTA